MNTPQTPTILVLRTCGPGGVAHRGFTYPLTPGAVVEAPDWRDDDKCGGGLHGLPWGVGEARYLAWDGNNGWVIEVEAVPGNYRHGSGDFVDKCKFRRGTVRLAAASREDCIALIQKHAPKDAAVNWAKQTGGNDSVQIAGIESLQNAGRYSIQRCGHGGLQTADRCSVQVGGSNVKQFAGTYSTQTADDKSAQVAGDNSHQVAACGCTQTAAHSSIQIGLYMSRQTAGAGSVQTAGDCGIQIAAEKSVQVAGAYSVQVAGPHSTQICQDCCFQKAGLRSVQIVKVLKPTFHVKTRAVTEAEADKWFRFVNGEWMPLTDAEIREVEKKLKRSL